MNKQQIISSVQSLLNSGRTVITVMHKQVAALKETKKFYDASLRQEVKNQKALKVILKELQHS